MNNKIFIKHKKNPILVANDLSHEVMYLLNPGAIKTENEYLMLMDAATLSTPIVLWIARSKDGVNFIPDPNPVRWPKWSDATIENCIYDPRITFIDNAYIIMYASQATGRGVRTGVVKTTDFKSFERIPQAETNENNRNSALFPEKIDGRYVRFDRPMKGEKDPGDICLSYSDNLSEWYDSKVMMKPRQGLWDGHKIGSGAVPIKTKEGWLEIYHGVDNSACNGFIYRLGTVLLDLENPSKVISRGEFPVLWPDKIYETSGRVPNVVFACNAIVENDSTVKVYYGAADSCIAMAEAKLDDLIESCFTKNKLTAYSFGA